MAAHLPGNRGGNRAGEEEPGMGALSRPGPFNRRRDADPLAGRDERRHVLLPRWSVEIGRKEKACFIRKKWVDPDHVSALKMVEDDLVGDGEERPVGTPAALHAGLPANSAHPFVGTNGGIAFPAGLRFFPQSREDVLPAPEEVPEKSDLLGGGGRDLELEGQAVERNRLWESRSGEILGQPSLQFLEPCERFLPVLLDPGQPGLFLGDRLADRFIIRHVSMPPGA